MKPGGRKNRWIFLAAICASALVLILNLLVNPWWIALWRFVQAAILFALIFFALEKWLIPWLTSKGQLPAVPDNQETKGTAMQVGQYVNVVADESRQEELDSKR